ncbi:MAG: hypothetical protein WBM84_04520 [Sedimenticolaceae bacterium]
MQSFDIYFLGQTLPEADASAVRRGVAKLFKVEDDAVERLFSGKPVRVKKGQDAEAASRYRAAFREIGALVQIVPAGSPAPQAVTPATIESGDPAAHDPATSPPEPGASGDFGLAEPGVILDETSPPPPADIDTGDLEALPPNSGSLEDCKVEKPLREIPDIGHLRLVDD